MAEWEGKTRNTATDQSGNLVSEKQWEEVQKKVAYLIVKSFIFKQTFTKWVNSHLRKVGSHLEDIQNDWQDGIKLMQLLRALYGLDLPKYNQNPKMRPQKLGNFLFLSLLKN